MTTFLAGFGIAFWKGWDLALVMLGCLPFLGLVGGVLLQFTMNATKKVQEAYAQVRLGAFPATPGGLPCHPLGASPATPGDVAKNGHTLCCADQAAAKLQAWSSCEGLELAALLLRQNLQICVPRFQYLEAAVKGWCRRKSD
jgi:ABC-type multidrug transport system fused ATPase/permease subunit